VVKYTHISTISHQYYVCYIGANTAISSSYHHKKSIYHVLKKGKNYINKYCIAVEILILTLRLSVNVFGKIIYKHERSLMWNVNSYIRSLQQSEGLTPRDLYWRLWGIINMLYCDKCHSHFHCWDLKGCRYHPNSSQGAGSLASECSCTRNTGFVILPQKKVKVFL